MATRVYRKLLKMHREEQDNFETQMSVSKQDDNQFSFFAQTAPEAATPQIFNTVSTSDPSLGLNPNDYFDETL